jgi:thiol:disulfide interchange protein
VAARWIVLSAIVLGAGILWISYHQKHKTPTVESIDQARAEALLNHKVLMVEFEADWCSDCWDLSKSLQERDIRDYLVRHVEALHVDVGQFNRNLDIARYLGVDVNQGIPAAVFFLPEQVPAFRKIGNAQILAYIHQLAE